MYRGGGVYCATPETPPHWAVSRGGGAPIELRPSNPHASLFWLSDSNSTGSIYPQDSYVT